jgi:hypothetical protein
MADYFITGVWFDTTETSKAISHVLLHQVNANGSWKHGIKTTEVDVIKLIKARKTIKTKTWNYEEADWNTGAVVYVETVNRKEVLRTKADPLIRDNLDNLIRMIAIAN